MPTRHASGPTISRHSALAPPRQPDSNVGSGQTNAVSPPRGGVTAIECNETIIRRRRKRVGHSRVCQQKPCVAHDWIAEPVRIPPDRSNGRRFQVRRNILAADVRMSKPAGSRRRTSHGDCPFGLSSPNGWANAAESRAVESLAKRTCGILRWAEVGRPDDAEIFAAFAHRTSSETKFWESDLLVRATPFRHTRG